MEGEVSRMTGEERRRHVLGTIAQLYQELELDAALELDDEISEELIEIDVGDEILLYLPEASDALPARSLLISIGIEIREVVALGDTRRVRDDDE